MRVLSKLSLFAASVAAASVVACSLGGVDELSGGDAGAGGTSDAGVDGRAGGAGDSGGGGFPGVGADNGTLCNADAACKSGHCVAGLCCDTSCDSPCMACAAVNKESGELDGKCAPAKAGTDPAGDCDEEASATCGKDGKCDGAGACRNYASGTACGAPTCADGIKTLPGACDGNGTCEPGSTVTCEPKACNGNVCQSDCTKDGDCGNGRYCAISGDCKDKIANGGACVDGRANECASGFCVDGYCCGSECKAGCMACDGAITTGGNGTCSPIKNGSDPDNDCSDMGAASCGTDGQCDGAGSCRQYGPTTQCAAGSCSGQTRTNAKTCNGSGMCAGGGTSDCAPYKCGSGNGCRTSCTDTAHCVSGSICSGGQCTGKKANGASCSDAGECQSGHCVDAVCCSGPCTGPCKACTAAKKGQGNDGICGHVKSGSDPDGNCSAEAKSTCGRDGQCDGAGGCRLWSSSTVCVAASCSGSTEQSADTCNGNGSCVNGGSSSCSPYTCGTSTCRTSCSSSSHCISTHYCSGSTCVLKKDDGATCSSASQCESGFCVHGRCCNNACSETCKSCSDGVLGAGRCSFIECGNPHNECLGGRKCNFGSCVTTCILK